MDSSLPKDIHIHLRNCSAQPISMDLSAETLVDKDTVRDIKARATDKETSRAGGNKRPVTCALYARTTCSIDPLFGCNVPHPLPDSIWNLQVMGLRSIADSQ